MMDRANLRARSDSLRQRLDEGEALDAEQVALELRAAGLSVVETAVVIAEGFHMRLTDVQGLLVRLALSGEDHYG